MTRSDFLLEMDSILDLPAGTLKGPEALAELEAWDSTAVVSFIALADTSNGTRVSPRDIVNCATVSDLLRIAKIDG